MASMSRSEPKTKAHPAANGSPATGDISAGHAPDGNDATIPGETADSPWGLPAKAWWQVIKRVWLMTGFHELGLLAAGVAFFTFLAITPLLAATVMIYGLVTDVGTVREQMGLVVTLVPPDATRLIENQLLRFATTNAGVTGLALVMSLAFAIYGGMRAASGIISALNIINQEHETRNFIALTLRAVLLTVAALLIALTGLLSGGVFAWMQTQTSFILGPWTDFFIKLLTWATAIMLGSLGFALIMRYGPDRRPAKWRWLTPGSVVATILWIAISFGFSLYVAYISNFNATYGSLSAIVVFLVWLFLSAYGVLLGALLNAEIERQTSVDTTVGSTRPPGHRGAVLADLVGAPLPDANNLQKRRLRHAERMRSKADEQPEAPEP